MADIILKDASGKNITYPGVETVVLNTLDGITQAYSKGTVAKNLDPIELNFADGDQTIYAPDGMLIKSVVIKKPDTLVAENIISGVEIAGIIGIGGSNHECEFEWTITTSPTCTEEGVETGKCSICGATDTREVPALGHNIVIDAAVAPTCTETGYTEGSHCSQCGLVFVAQEAVPATGHDYEDGVCKNCHVSQGSVSLAFTSNGDGTCYVSGIGDCTDSDIIIPSESLDGETVASIGDSAFSARTNLTSVTIPNTVTSIEYGAFYGCTGLTDMVIPDSVTAIGAKAFEGCSGLANIVISDGISSLEMYTFNKCTSLTNVIIPNGVVDIKDYVFRACSKLASVTIPESVTNIGIGVFYGCRKLTTINYCGTEEQWNAITKGTNWDYNTGDYTIVYNYSA